MDIVISDSVIISLGVAMAVCIALPFIFIIANRKKMMLTPISVGVVSYFAFCVAGTGMVLGTFFSSPAKSSLLPALIFAILSAAVILIGHYFMLKYLSGKRSGGGVPLGYGLGYASVNLLIMNGATMFSNLSVALAVNNNGFEKVATTVEDSQALFKLVESIANSPIQNLLMGALELVCFFAVSVAVAVFVWYGVVMPEKRVKLLSCAAGMELLTTGVMTVYSCGFLSMILAEVIYIAAAVVASVLAFRLYRKTEGGPRYMADPVTRI